MFDYAVTTLCHIKMKALVKIMVSPFLDAVLATRAVRAYEKMNETTLTADFSLTKAPSSRNKPFCLM